ncbi:MAG: LytTR family DNA-binding domain-containing protein [Bacteroidota bacterium]
MSHSSSITIKGLSERKFFLLICGFLSIVFAISMVQNIIRYGMHDSYRPFRSVLYLSNSLLLFLPMIPLILIASKKWLQFRPTSYWMGGVVLVGMTMTVFFLYSNVGMYVLGFYDTILSGEYLRSYLGREALWHLIMLTLTMVYVWFQRPSPALSQTTPQMLTASLGKKRLTIPANRIEWIEVDDHYLRLHSEEKVMMMRETMENLAQQLAPDFIRVHRKYLVNKQAVVGHERDKRTDFLLLRSGERIKVSRSFAHLIKEMAFHDK